jgi:hypothetical protein
MLKICTNLKHSHIWTELFNERLDDGLRGGCRGNANALGGDLLTSVLEVESHNTMELEVLQHKKILLITEK